MTKSKYVIVEGSSQFLRDLFVEDDKHVLTGRKICTRERCKTSRGATRSPDLFFLFFFRGLCSFFSPSGTACGSTSYLNPPKTRNSKPHGSKTRTRRLQPGDGDCDGIPQLHVQAVGLRRQGPIGFFLCYAGAGQLICNTWPSCTVTTPTMLQALALR